MRYSDIYEKDANLYRYDYEKGEMQWIKFPTQEDLEMDRSFRQNHSHGLLVLDETGAQIVEKIPCPEEMWENDATRENFVRSMNSMADQMLQELGRFFTK